MKKSIAASVAVFVIGFSSCSSAGDSEESSNDAPLVSDISTGVEGGSEESPTSSAPSSSEGLPLADGETYTEIVTPVNCLSKSALDYQDANRIGGDQIDANALGGLQAIYGEIASARATAAAELLEHSWPDPISSTVTSMSQFWFGLSKFEEDLAAAPDLAAWNARMQNYIEASSNPSNSGLSSLIRQALGLPNNGADYIAMLKC